MKKRYIIGGVIVGSLLLGGLTNNEPEYNYVDVSEIGNETVGTSNPTTEQIQEPVIEYIDVTSYDLMAQYDENEAAANIKYKGKDIRVTGTVTGVGESFSKYYVTLQGHKQYGFEVQCFVSDDWESYIAKLKKGDTVTLKGKCSGMGLNVSVDNCEFE